MTKRLDLDALAAKAASAQPQPQLDAEDREAIATEAADKADRRALVREPTQQSIPILGPVTAPVAPIFAIAPPVLTAGQKAAATRKANAAAGIPPNSGKGAAVPAPAAVSARADGLDLVLMVLEGDAGLRLGFRFERADGAAVEVPAGELVLPSVGLSAWVDGTEVRRSGVEIMQGRVSLATLEAALPTLRAIDRFLTVAEAESEDPSFAFAVSSLSVHFRVARVELNHLDGRTTNVKRGQAYLAAHRLSEALLARNPA